MAIYRKIYERHFGPIPKEENGRTFEIHHIDGDRTNNSINNLRCVSIEEHYNIHYAQQDWGACGAIAQRMNLSLDKISNLRSKHALARVADGTNPFLILSKIRSENGTHNWMTEQHSEKTRERQISRLELGDHEFCKRSVCPYCDKEGQYAVMARWHFNNCKLNPNYTSKPKRKYKKKRLNQTT